MIIKIRFFCVFSMTKRLTKNINSQKLGLIVQPRSTITNNLICGDDVKLSGQRIVTFPGLNHFFFKLTSPLN